MTPAEVLRKAADLIRPPGCWTQGVRARNAEGEPVIIDDPKAVSFCFVTAILKQGDLMISLTAMHCVEKVVGELDTIWNDHPDRTQAEVVAALRMAADEWEAQITC